MSQISNATALRAELGRWNELLQQARTVIARINAVYATYCTKVPLPLSASRAFRLEPLPPECQNLYVHEDLEDSERNCDQLRSECNAARRALVTIIDTLNTNTRRVRLRVSRAVNVLFLEPPSVDEQNLSEQDLLGALSQRMDSIRYNIASLCWSMTPPEQRGQIPSPYPSGEEPRQRLQQTFGTILAQVAAAERSFPIQPVREFSESAVERSNRELLEKINFMQAFYQKVSDATQETKRIYLELTKQARPAGEPHGEPIEMPQGDVSAPVMNRALLQALDTSYQNLHTMLAALDEEVRALYIKVYSAFRRSDLAPLTIARTPLPFDRDEKERSLCKQAQVIQRNIACAEALAREGRHRKYQLGTTPEHPVRLFERLKETIDFTSQTIDKWLRRILRSSSSASQRRPREEEAPVATSSTVPLPRVVVEILDEESQETEIPRLVLPPRILPVGGRLASQHDEEAPVATSSAAFPQLDRAALPLGSLWAFEGDGTVAPEPTSPASRIIYNLKLRDWP